MRAIVLSGGGSNGSYEIGFWKAIRKLNIKYDIVTGTSVGALNAALMVQKSYFKALYLWLNIKYEDVFEMKNYTKDEIKKFYINGVLKGGVDVSNLEKTIKKYININKFYKSNIKFGLITVKFPSFKPVEMTKDNIKKNQLVDYLVASSSCFPAFKLKKIEKEYYIDGGFYDNMPVNLAVKLGADEIIAVDLNQIGIKRNLKYDVNISYITSKNKIDSFLKFEKNSARRGIRLGYNDTMKYYKKLSGNKYTFKLNDLDNNFNKYKDKFKNNLDKFLNASNHFVLKNIYKDDKSFKKELNRIIEKLGYLCYIDDSYIYSIKKYNKLLIKNFKDKNVLGIYNYLINNDKKNINKVVAILKDEFLMAIYMLTIKE